MDFVLASRSPRRQELLALVGIAFSVLPTATDEQRQPGESPEHYVRRLSRDKAQAAACILNRPALVLAADTIVVDGDDVLEKPVDAADAAAMLRRLRGRTHRVFTAVTLLDAPDGEPVTEMANSPVRMRATSDAEIAAYVASGDPFDKAGAYAIQHAGFHPAEAFGHCFANVMGLPLCHVTRMLRDRGIVPPVDVPGACQRHLAYACPVSEDILTRREQRR